MDIDNEHSENNDGHDKNNIRHDDHDNGKIKIQWTW